SGRRARACRSRQSGRASLRTVERLCGIGDPVGAATGSTRSVKVLLVPRRGARGRQQRKTHLLSARVTCHATTFQFPCWLFQTTVLRRWSGQNGCPLSEPLKVRRR